MTTYEGTGLELLAAEFAALLGFLGSLTLPKDVALLAGTAFVGAYTTFSGWMREALESPRSALLLAAPLLLGLLAVWAGRALGRLL